MFGNLRKRTTELIQQKEQSDEEVGCNEQRRKEKNKYEEGMETLGELHEEGKEKQERCKRSTKEEQWEKKKIVENGSLDHTEIQRSILSTLFAESGKWRGG